MSLFAEGSFLVPSTDDSSHTASSGSTPPTTIADSASLHSDSSSKNDPVAVADVAPAALPVVSAEDVPSPRRARRARASSPIYNLSRLSGTSAHGWRRSKGDAVADRRRRTISGDTLLHSVEDSTGAHGQRRNSAAPGSLDASHSPSSLKTPNAPSTLRRPQPSPRSLRSSSRFLGATGAAAAPLSLTANHATATATATTSTRIRRRSRKSIEASLAQLPLELRRLQDTKEFAHIDDIPVLHTVWSNGKFVDPDEAAPTEQPARKKTKIETPDKEPEVEDAPEPIIQVERQRSPKKYLTKGLYAGQEYPTDVTRCLSTAEKKELAQCPELKPKATFSKAMPPPIFTGLRLLLNGRDFKLPYNVCNPLPPGQPKPDEWKKMTKNRFIGGSKEIWRKLPHIHDYQSKCVCSPEDGCGESCQNRIMLYECDETNCNVGKAYCTNRAFADLTARRTKGGKYRVGVEVIKTSDRGYGVRSNRCFEPHQIIMEYTGEIITEEECERRMNEVYKHNECYYLMSFDQNMIIDATTGSIARFVNHSCNPNCRMIKWIVSGQPRMALFAGDRPIVTGDELTYDYNFDPFSAKNVQRCLCGESNCRGVLGPRPREARHSKADKNSSHSHTNHNNDHLKKAGRAATTAGKRKLEELVTDDDGKKSQRKRKGGNEDKEEGAKWGRKGETMAQPAMKPKPRSRSAKLSRSIAGLRTAKGAAAGTAHKGGSVAKTNDKRKTTDTIPGMATATAAGTTTTITKSVRANALSRPKSKSRTMAATAAGKRIPKTYGSGSRAKIPKKQRKTARSLSRRVDSIEPVKDAILVRKASSHSTVRKISSSLVSPRKPRATTVDEYEFDMDSH